MIFWGQDTDFFFRFNNFLQIFVNTVSFFMCYQDELKYVFLFTLMLVIMYPTRLNMGVKNAFLRHKKHMFLDFGHFLHYLVEKSVLIFMCYRDSVIYINV